MIVIAVVQGKGGVGKTTLAINLAGEIVSFGRSVSVVRCGPASERDAMGRAAAVGLPGPAIIRSGCATT